jgi:hypothetical protein
MFAGIIFLLSFTQYESPRYLIKVGKDEEAVINLSRVCQLPREDPYVLQEINNSSYKKRKKSLWARAG